MIDRFIAELVSANRMQNLISRQATLDEIREHIEDSQALLIFVSLKAKKVLDMGSGQGFPAIPLAMAEPESIITMVESDLKKCLFLEGVVNSLGLANARVIRARVEELAHTPEHRGVYEIVTCRAVSSLPTLIEWGLPFLCRGGILAAWKGAKALEELDASRRALEILGGELLGVKKYQVRERGGNLVLISKKGDTPEQYPRKGGIAKKRPLK